MRKDIECNAAFQPKNIPLEDIYINKEVFQNRVTPYSEESVSRIIQSVLNGSFIVEIFDPILLWHKENTQQLFLLSGHSRYEAFKRLSSQYTDHPQVKKYVATYAGLFSHIPSRIIKNISYDQAQIISQISNVLATPETDIERAKLYRNFRNQGKSRAEIEEFGKKYEGNNRPRIRAYSYLNPHGSLITLLECFERNNDEKNVIKRIATRVGNARMKYSCLTNRHEQELDDRLMKYEGYGNKAGQVNSQSKFLEVLKHKIEKISPRDDETPLNMRGEKSHSYAMAVYYKMLKGLQKNKSELKKYLGQSIESYQKACAKEDTLTTYKKSLSKILGVPLESLSKAEDIEAALFSIKEYFSPETSEKVRDETIKQILRIQQEIKQHKGKKEKFLELTKKELKINFDELSA
jgi:hypothetical protein